MNSIPKTIYDVDTFVMCAMVKGRDVKIEDDGYELGLGGGGDMFWTICTEATIKAAAAYTFLAEDPVLTGGERSIQAVKDLIAAFPAEKPDSDDEAGYEKCRAADRAITEALTKTGDKELFEYIEKNIGLYMCGALKTRRAYKKMALAVMEAAES